MRRWTWAVLLLCLLPASCAEEPHPPPSAPSRTGPPRRAERLPPLPPDLEPAPDRAAATEPPPEPRAWGDLDALLGEEPDPEAERTRRSVEETKVFVDFDAVPLERAVRFVTEQTGVEIEVLDSTWEEIAPDDLLVSHEAKATTVAGVLDRMCASKRICWWTEGRVVKIAPRPPRAPTVALRIPVGGLTDRRKDPETGATRGYEGDALVDMIHERIDPEIWDEGGEVRFDHETNCLVVSAPRSTQRKVLELLRGLSGGRGPR